MPTQYHLDAIVLSERAFKEHDRIVSTYTKEMGKVDVHAVGTRKILSKLGGHLVPVRRTQLVVVKARFLPKAIAAVSQHNFAPTMDNSQAMAYSGALLRLVNDFTKEGHADRELFYLLLHALRGINQLAEDGQEERPPYDEVARAFFSSFITLLGYTPTPKQCFTCRKAVTSDNRHRIEGTLHMCRTCVTQSTIDPEALEPNRDFYAILSTVGK